MGKLVVTFACLSLSLLVQGGFVFRDLTLSARRIAPDGFQRSALVTNGQFPGPLITATKGDTVKIAVNNELFDPTMRRSTSIHWHGIDQHRNAFDDGPSFVTQCPIAPGHSYTYGLALGEQTGTYWYHSHLSTQYVDGIRGPLVIYDPNDPQRQLYDVDDESTIITVADWYHSTALNLTNAFEGSLAASEPVPDSGLINGIGRFTGGPQVPWARINVKQGKRYRFRVISLSAEGQFEFSIANHSMVVIEADGTAHEPYAVDSFPILPGQRYSVVVTADKPVDNYWIRATQTIRGQTTSPTNPNFNGSNTFAVLHYLGAANADPKAAQQLSLLPGQIEFEEHNLVPLVDPAAPGGDRPADKFINLTFAPGTINANVWLINGIQYKSPSVPTLLNVLANGFTNASQFSPNEHVFVLDPNIIVEVEFVGTPGHPFHLHGHSFSVVQSASGGGLNYINPPRRDVVASGVSPDNGQSTRIRFETDNAGPWFLHCHIDWHLNAGLAVTLVENPNGIIKGPESVVPNAQWQRLCQIYDKLPAALQ
ncbi:laccase [Hysterangium stoloniferum]|nr:laccase [Hysterangium stoloniferum]